MNKIVYFHGFASGCHSESAKYFEKCGSLFCPEYDSARTFQENRKSLQEQIENRFDIETLTMDDTVFVGTSLGGFYAKQLAEIFKVNSVIINPATYPFESLLQFKGKNKNFQTGEEFALTDEVIRSYAYEKRKRVYETPCIVYVSDEDEILPKNSEDCVGEYGRYAVVMITKDKHRITSKWVGEYIDGVNRLLESMIVY